MLAACCSILMKTHKEYSILRRNPDSPVLPWYLSSSHLQIPLQGPYCSPSGKQPSETLCEAGCNAMEPRMPPQQQQQARPQEILFQHLAHISWQACYDFGCKFGHSFPIPDRLHKFSQTNFPSLALLPTFRWFLPGQMLYYLERLSLPALFSSYSCVLCLAAKRSSPARQTAAQHRRAGAALWAGEPLPGSFHLRGGRSALEKACTGRRKKTAPVKVSEGTGNV